MHPDDEALAAVALGEPLTPADAEHVAGCADCAAVVAELRATLGRLREGGAEELITPPDSVWAAIAAEAGIPASTTPDGPATAAPRPVGPSAEPDELAGRRDQRRPRTRWLVAAAAAGVALGLAGAELAAVIARPTETVVARAELSTLDTQRQGGEADLLERGDDVKLRLQVEPLDAGTGFLEVWLINTDLTRMVSLGQLPNGSTSQDFVVSPTTIEQGYLIVDISLEKFDDQPQHSGDTLLRGTLS